MFKDLTLIILGGAVCSAYFYFQDYRRKQKEKKQERLNDIKIKTN
jgi:preprotein translocase subunit YajC